MPGSRYADKAAARARPPGPAVNEPLKPLPKPSRVVATGLRVLCAAGASREAALGFIASMAEAAQRTLAHDDPDGLVWLYQIRSQAQVRLAREHEEEP